MVDERLTVHLPEEVAEELVSDGVASEGELVAVRKGLGEAAEALPYALMTLNAVASAVTVYANRETLEAIVMSLTRWRRHTRDRDDGKPYRLSADGPGGSAKFELVDPPDSAALAQFLEENVWTSAND